MDFFFHSLCWELGGTYNLQFHVTELWEVLDRFLGHFLFSLPGTIIRMLDPLGLPSTFLTFLLCGFVCFLEIVP